MRSNLYQGNVTFYVDRRLAFAQLAICGLWWFAVCSLRFAVCGLRRMSTVFLLSESVCGVR